MTIILNWNGRITMTKQEWLDEQVFVDEFGRPYNLSDVPMTYMRRENALNKRNIGKNEIKKIWKQIKKEYHK